MTSDVLPTKILGDWNTNQVKELACETQKQELRVLEQHLKENLLQFIAATNDDRSPLFVTDLLHTCLRDFLSEQVLIDSEICNLPIEIARGLNYLHLKEALPIVRRDISSTNVLLCRRGVLSCRIKDQPILCVSLGK